MRNITNAKSHGYPWKTSRPFILVDGSRSGHWVGHPLGLKQTSEGSFVGRRGIRSRDPLTRLRQRHLPASDGTTGRRNVANTHFHSLLDTPFSYFHNRCSLRRLVSLTPCKNPKNLVKKSSKINYLLGRKTEWLFARLPHIKCTRLGSVRSSPRI